MIKDVFCVNLIYKFSQRFQLLCHHQCSINYYCFANVYQYNKQEGIKRYWNTVNVKIPKPKITLLSDYRT